ncbi:MAG: 50S ribosomal protein L6 [Phycisphaerae bacterium]|nr:50S ribosomal protein L6 [Phycisphaerae bacterium]
MSRIGKKPVSVPSSVNIDLNESDCCIKVSGPKGDLTYDWNPVIDVRSEDGAIVCSIKETASNDKVSRAQWGTTRARIQNMVLGVTEGYSKRLKIVGVGWNAKDQGRQIRLNVGYCHPVDLTPPNGVEFTIEQNGDIIVSGPDKHQVGQFAANIRDQRRPEPYNGKGIMYHDEVIIRKQGKVFGS